MGGGGAISGGKFHGEQIIGNLSKKVMYCIHPYIRPRGRCIFQKGGLLLHIKNSTLESSGNGR